MGQAKQRREKLGALYGTPEGSNRPQTITPLSNKSPKHIQDTVLSLISKYLTTEARKDILDWCASPIKSWEKIYKTLPNSPYSAIKVMCTDGQVFIEMIPENDENPQ